ncbi:FimB/Mfa2 family fimbrial subunit [Bacteroides sp. 51]|uniref:FimB/Mfa2 family fimbrial subunit n=1 Tax=Bacteroides sp. 51 TaxID=2302938 RepID=UPI0013D07587|nr:FimB/Mfa2 family fimbrial subunit [Bacteroides sp. 51]NDV82837.1 hypothetical protein [Bacteroides sp. 51]
MKLARHIHLLILGVLIASSGILTSCNNLNETLPECRLFVKFKYDYNLLSADAFHTQVDKVELYVFDKEGKFLFTQSEEGAPLATGSYQMEVTVPVGEYKFMAWAGARDSYDITSLTKGVSTINELKLKLKRDQSLIINKELEPLWYGEINDVNFTGTRYQTETINLIKDTNKVRFVFYGQTPEWTINVNDYRYQIIESNGYLDYDNSLLNDDVISYEPYYKEQRSDQGALVELNTMRLMADRGTRFVVTHIASGTQVFNINLIEFLEMTEMEMYPWGAQEYFDRKDEYALVLFFSNKLKPDDKWVAIQLNINQWTWYFQEEGDL